MSIVTDWKRGDRAYLDSDPEHVCEVTHALVCEPNTDGWATVKDPSIPGGLQTVQISRLTRTR